MQQQTILSKAQLAILRNEDKTMSGGNAHLNEKHRQLRERNKKPKKSLIQKLFS